MEEQNQKQARNHFIDGCYLKVTLVYRGLRRTAVNALAKGISSVQFWGRGLNVGQSCFSLTTPPGIGESTRDVQWIGVSQNTAWRQAVVSTVLNRRMTLPARNVLRS
jgi:hypothetical protein